MSTQDLENNIKQYLEVTHGVCYNKPLPITIEDNVYTCIWYLNKDKRPVVIQGEFDSDEEFLIYIYKEIDSRRLFTIMFTVLEKQFDNVYSERDENTV